MADLALVPDDATAVSICPCGAVTWSAGDSSSGDAQAWFDDFDAAHADCDPDLPAEHTEVGRPAFGYVADERDFFIRASDARRLAEAMRDQGARFLANAVLEYDVDDIDRLLYRRDVAALSYAQAVYEVEAAKVCAA